MLVPRAREGASWSMSDQAMFTPALIALSGAEVEPILSNVVALFAHVGSQDDRYPMIQ
jgi:hypothetical protein